MSFAIISVHRRTANSQGAKGASITFASTKLRVRVLMALFPVDASWLARSTLRVGEGVATPTPHSAGRADF